MKSDSVQQAEESKKTAVAPDEVKGFALTVKENFIDSILAICKQIRPTSFLHAASSDEERPFTCTGNPSQLLLIAEESTLITALDPKQILSWPDFEYVLCLVIENRILRLYQAHLERQYHLKWKELDDILL